MMIRTLLLSLSCALLASGANAKDFHAESFVKDKCTGCHDSSIYTRSNRKVDSLPRLESQVRFCDANLGIKMFDDDVTAVVKHLNDKYYQFK